MNITSNGDMIKPSNIYYGPNDNGIEKYVCIFYLEIFSKKIFKKIHFSRCKKLCMVVK